jgi:spermidine synthase
MVASLIILVPICGLLGFLFSLGAKIYQAKEGIGLKAGSVYAFESLGSAIGGLIAGFLLIRWMNALEIMVILSLSNICAAFFLSIAQEKSKKRLGLFALSIGLCAGFILFWLFGGLNYLQKFSLNKQWQGYGFLSSVNSVYGNIVVGENQSQRSFFYNGAHLYSVPDQQKMEEAAHFALLEHADPKNVLLIGAGAGGLLEEVLKHPVESVDYLELDPAIIKALENYLPENKTIFLKDRKIRIENVDGRFFIKRQPKKYDCLILHLGDPYTAQLNRYYTVEFFEEVKSILKDGGVLSFGLTSSESYLNIELKKFLQSIYASLKTVFIDVKVIPGETAYFLACDKPGVLTYDYNLLLKRAKARGLDLKYVRDYYLFDKFSARNISYMQDALEPRELVLKNYDFRPVSYYYGMIFWVSRSQEAFLNKIFNFMKPSVIWVLLFILSVLIFLSAKRRIDLAKKRILLLTVAVAGFTQISAQIIILLSFQIIYGYLFYKLGILIAFFMIGLFFGGFILIKAMARIKEGLRQLIIFQIAICLYLIFLPICLKYMANQTGVVACWLGSNVGFALLAIIAGFIAGANFTLVNKIYLGNSEKASLAAGINYSMDLFGSALGALITALFLIPVLGIFQSCFALAIINAIILFRLIISRQST